MTEGRDYLTCLIGLPPGGRAAWSSELSRSRKGKDAESLRRRGRALSMLGRDAEALEAFGRSLALEPASAEGLAWRGEAHLLASRREQARADLDRAVALSPKWPWGRLLRAVCCLTEGDTAGAEKELAATGRRPEAVLVSALLEGQRGAAQKGWDAVNPEIKARPSGPLYAVRALLRLGLSDLPGALGDLNKAAELEPSAWILMQQADALNRTGFYRPALEAAARAAALVPESPEPHLQAANIYFDQAFYPEALAEMELALKRRPDDAGLLSRRARFHLVLGRMAEAEEGLKRACRLAPESGQLRFERLNVAALRGRFAEVLKEIRGGALQAPFDSYLTGYVLCRRGDRAAAVEHFLAAAERSGGGFAERCRFYALVCRVLSGPKPAVRNPPQFFLCSVGIHHPYQISVENLRALDDCEILYNNLGDPQISDFLGLFRAEVRAVTRVDNEPAMGRVRRIIAGVRRGKLTGFVTRIHPFIYRRIANDLVTVCREKGITFRAFGAVSLTEVAWSLGVSAREHGSARGPFGARVFDIVFLTNHPEMLEPRHPTVVYCIANDQHRKQFCAVVRERYAKDDVAFLLAGSGDREQEVVSVDIAGLEAKLLSLDLGTVMYLPPTRRGTSWKN
ncbi:MAG: tetratricopeptide repeat protein [Elusimicrobia bacterium]|nr:tetratricopeptide repeat protein [Elusimicrobiota bacterium]